MCSTNFGSMLIISSLLLVLVIYYVGEFFLSARGHIILFKFHFFFSTTMIGDDGIFSLRGEC